MIGDLVERLIASGVDPVDAASIVAEAFALGASSARPQNPRISADENRRAKDRERKRRSREFRGIPRNSVECPKPHIEEESKKERTISRGTRISADWKPSESDRAWSLSRGMTEAEIDSQAERFRDWWLAKAGRDATKTRWDLTWCNWCRSFLERAGRATGPPSTETTWLERETERIRAERAKTNGKGTHEAGNADGAGVERANHGKELFP